MMECTTGLTDDEFDELLAWLREEGVEGYPPILGLSGSLRATLMYLRQNIVQAVIGEILGVSQPTVSRAIKALTEAISRTLAVLLLTAEEVPRDCDCRGGRHPPPLPGLARPPRSVVGQARARGHERPGSWSGARRRVRASLRSLSGVRARRGGPGRLRTAGGNGSLRVDRRQGVRGKGDDHPAQEAPQRRTERNREGGEQERQQDPPGRKSAPSPTSSPGESSTRPTADPWKHSSRPSPRHSHFMPSRPPPE